MRSCSKQFACVASLLIAAVLPASAGSITYKNTATSSNGENVSATFTLTPSSNGKIDSITKGALTFSGALGNFTIDFSGSCTAGSAKCGFTFTDAGDKGIYNINLSQMNVGGSIGKLGRTAGTYTYSLSVPEGGSKFSYLAPAGLVIFGGIFLTGFLRPRVRQQESIASNR